MLQSRTTTQRSVPQLYRRTVVPCKTSSENAALRIFSSTATPSPFSLVNKADFLTVTPRASATIANYQDFILISVKFFTCLIKAFSGLGFLDKLSDFF